MKVRKRTWRNRDGKTKSAWMVDYIDPLTGERRREVLKGIKSAREADAAASLIYSAMWREYYQRKGGVL